MSRTTSAPEVEEVLGALSLLLNEGGLRQIKVIASELSGALHGREPQIRDLLDQLNSFVGTLDDQKGKITTALSDIDQLAITLNKQKQVLTSSLDIFPGALKVLSQRARQAGQPAHQPVAPRAASRARSSTRPATSWWPRSRSSSRCSTSSTRPAATSRSRCEILGTFPFPLGKSREFVKGDYANLAAYVNLDLSDTLCGIDDQTIDPKHLLCKAGQQAAAVGAAPQAGDQLGRRRVADAHAHRVGAVIRR